MTYCGEHAGGLTERARQAAATLQAAGVPTEARADIASVLWSKACNATGVFGITLLARASTQRLFSDPDLMRAYLALVRETAAVATAYGIQVGDYAGFPPIRTYVERSDQATLDELPPKPTDGDPPGYASMTRDLLAGRPLEVEAIFGDIVERAARKGVPVPCLTFTRDILRALDTGRHE
jgi:2-dehydropantoate 2-reductase